MLKEILILILKFVIYYNIIIGSYVLIGALYLRCSIWATKDTWCKCIKQSWINSCRMKPWYSKIEDEKRGIYEYS